MERTNLDAEPQAGSPEQVFASLGVRPGEVIDDKFRVESLIGVGGMGFVLKATHVDLDETVALKCLHPQWKAERVVVERFAREARAAAKIKNGHVAQVYDVGKLPAGVPFMVMEYLRGEDLSAVLARNEVLSMHDLVGWMIEACEGLAEAHAHGIVHRDVKPDNICIVTRRDGRRIAKLLDFGISKQLLTGQDDDLARTQELVGTPLYMSPEQVRLSRELDHRTDIWSLGAVFYEALTGRPPFTGEGITDLCARILEDVVVSPSALRPFVTPELDRIVLRCLEKDPKDRYPSAAELAAELLAFAHPRHHAQVERITRTLRAAGLTDLALASVPAPPDITSPIPLVPRAPAVPSFSETLAEGTTSRANLAVTTTPSAPSARPWRWVALAAAFVLGLAVIGVLAMREPPAPIASTNHTEGNVRQAGAAAAPPPVTHEVPVPAPSASAEATASAEPPPVVVHRPRSRLTQKKTAEPEAPAPTPQKPRLDIEMAR